MSAIRPVNTLVEALHPFSGDRDSNCGPCSSLWARILTFWLTISGYKSFNPNGSPVQVFRPKPYDPGLQPFFKMCKPSRRLTDNLRIHPPDNIMKTASIFLILCLLLVSAVPANAVILRGVVTEVRDGQSVVVLSGGRTFVVSLIGVDAPESDQDFGGASQQHLAYLVLNKPVEIEFSQLDSDRVIGKVICSQRDIGLQVIRDGV